MQVRINGDLALFKAILYLLVQKENSNPGSQFDWEFINSKTIGVEALLENIKKQKFDFLVQESGVSEKEIRDAAELIASKRK